MWDSVIQSTDKKGGLDLIHALEILIFSIKFIRMEHLVLKILFKLVIALLKRFEVVVEREHRSKVIIWRLVTLNLFILDLAMFALLFLNAIDINFDTERINRLSGFKVRKLGAFLEECTVER
jgi:hypothetical protein